jgi:hypothetical protein
MEPGGSLPHSQEPATCPYPEPAQSSLIIYAILRKWVEILKARRVAQVPATNSCQGLSQILKIRNLALEVCWVVHRTAVLQSMNIDAVLNNFPIPSLEL